MVAVARATCGGSAAPCAALSVTVKVSSSNSSTVSSISTTASVSAVLPGAKLSVPLCAR